MIVLPVPILAPRTDVCKFLDATDMQTSRRRRLAADCAEAISLFELLETLFTHPGVDTFNCSLMTVGQDLGSINELSGWLCKNCSS
jgi:hypothetical protein